MKHKQILSAVLSAALLVGTAFAAEPADAPAVIEISTAEQLCAFSRNCTLDTWSQGKTAVLTANIDLSGADFSPVPTFGGTFEGGGHTISGLSITQDGSYQGLFRYVQESGVVRNLKVSGHVAPGGSASAVGGIVGRNYGTLQNCSFRGTAAGKTNVGGIAGINEGAGELVSCSASGSISGEHFTGGIMGQNLGAAVSCENRAQVNTREETVSVTLEDLNWEQVNSTENVRAHTDSGGIAGFSSGILQSCTNYGAVGYPHMGYNVGGIVGRQSGFLDGCTNAGTVHGRKDVGGVAGQLEPYLMLQFTEDSLQKLDGELDVLRSLLRQLGDETSGTGDLIDLRADALSDHLEQIRGGSHDIADWTDEFLDGTIDTVNELSARVTRTFDRLEPIFGDLSDTGDGLGEAFRRAGRVFDDADAAKIWGEEAAADARSAFDRMGNAMDDVQDALQAVRESLQALRRSPAESDARAAAIEQLTQAIVNLQEALRRAGTVPQALADILRALAQSGGIIAGETPEWLTALGDAFRQGADAIDALWQGLSGYITGSTDGIGLRERLTRSQEQLRRGLSLGTDAMEALRRASSNLNDAFDNLEILADELDGTLSGIGDAFAELDGAMDFLERAARGMEDLSRELADDSALEIPALNSDYTGTVDRIFGSLDDIADEVSGLRTDLRGSGDRLHSTADAINDQLGVISDLLMDGYEEILDDSKSEGDLLEDISDTDDSGTQGRITHAVNEGRVEGDVDVGGIAGSMAIEYDLDPEDDVTSAGRRSTNFRYQTRAVIVSSRNEGDVTAKKNHVGGIVGRMELGRVSACEGYGTVESTDGSYAGGIAGASYSAIRDSWAKCTLTGEDYVGGIAGFATDLSGCKALTRLTAAGECVGAIAGEADGALLNNVFVGDACGAVDGISYTGRAEPVSYETLQMAEGLPAAFQTFTVTFLVDGKLLAQASTGFDGTLEEIPEIPAREGQFGEWSDSDFSRLRANKTVEAVYTPFITVLESDANRDGKPLLLAEGEFDRHGVLALSPAENLHAPGDAYHAVVSHSVGTRSGHILRALAEETDNAVWLAEDGRWRRADSIRDGSYLVFSIEGDEAVYCVGRETNQELTLLIAGGIAALVIAALLRRRRRRRKKKRRAAA